MPNRCYQHLFDIPHPELNIPVPRVHLFHEVNLLSFARVHSVNGVIVSELEVSHGLEDLAEVRTHISDFLGLGEDFEELVI